MGEKGNLLDRLERRRTVMRTLDDSIEAEKLSGANEVEIVGQMLGGGAWGVLAAYDQAETHGGVTLNLIQYAICRWSCATPSPPRPPARKSSPPFLLWTALRSRRKGTAQTPTHHRPGSKRSQPPRPSPVEPLPQRAG